MTAVAETPLRRRIRWGWVWIAVLLVAGGLVGAAIATNEWRAKELLDPDSPGPDGARAIVQILRDHGVEVVVARDLDAAEAALAPGTTLVMPDPVMLSDGAVQELVTAVDDVVVVQSTSRMARVLFSASTRGYAPGDEVAPECTQPDAARAGAIVPGQLFTRGSAGSACYPVAGGFGLLSSSSDGIRRVLIDGRELFTNEHLADGANAALGIGLLGHGDRLVWYVPSPLDSDLEVAPTLGELTPPWVTPVLVLLAVTAAVAGIWRGRRFGPLVAENLPVTVRASETMEGRARLHERAGDAAGALDTLRQACADRIARLLGLGPAATMAEVADAAASRLGVDRGIVRDILIDAVPDGPRSLVAAADRLRDLEDAVRHSLREPDDPTERTRT